MQSVKQKYCFPQNKGFFLLLCCIYLLNVPLPAQTLKQQVSQAMEQVRIGKFYNGSEEPFAKAIANEPSTLLDAIIPYVSDSMPKVRLQAYDLIYLASRKSPDQKLRQTAVQYLAYGCGDKDSGNAGRAGKYLPKFQKDDFNTLAKDSLASYIRRGVYYLDNILMIAGYVNLTNSKPDIRNVLVFPRQSDKVQWAAHIALSRMGDSTETAYCIRVVQSKQMNNTIVYNLVPGLIYTRQKVAFDYLITILNSEEKNCNSSNPDNDSRILCGYRVMEFLAPVIKDFPLQTIPGVNQIKTNNYDAALETARKWFKNKAGNYEILNDKY
jgi:hypothetical protein